MSRRTPAAEAVASMIRHGDLSHVDHVPADDIREALAQLDGERRRQVEVLCWEGLASTPHLAHRVGDCIHPAWVAYAALHAPETSSRGVGIASCQGRLYWRVAGVEIDPEKIPATPAAVPVRKKLAHAALNLYTNAIADLGMTIEALRRQVACAELGVLSAPSREHVVCWVERMWSPSAAFELANAAAVALEDASTTEAQRVAASALLEGARLELARSRERIAETIARGPKWHDEGAQR